MKLWILFFVLLLLILIAYDFCCYIGSQKGRDKFVMGVSLGSLILGANLLSAFLALGIPALMFQEMAKASLAVRLMVYLLPIGLNWLNAVVVLIHYAGLGAEGFYKRIQVINVAVTSVVLMVVLLFGPIF